MPESFNNFTPLDEDQSNTVFRDVTLLTLSGFIAIVLLLLPWLNLKTKSEVIKEPVGSVIIESNVEIGANCCIDRGCLGKTIISSGCKLDNLIQIAHNSHIGKNTLIAAQCGLTGSVEIGENVTIGGQVGIYATIEDNVVTGGAGSSVNEYLVEKGYEISITNFGIPDQIISHGSQDELYAEIGLDKKSLEYKINEIYNYISRNKKIVK